MEEWKPIKDFEGFYEVSNFGRVISLPRNGTISSKRILKHKIDKDGYHQVTLRKNGTKKYVKVHRLVGETFIENRDNKQQINHLDGNKNNNVVSNLEWCTPQENSLHSVRCLKNVNTTFYKPKKIVCVETGEVFNSINDAGRKYRVSPQCIRKCAKGEYNTIKGKHWKFL